MMRECKKCAALFLMGVSAGWAAAAGIDPEIERVLGAYKAASSLPEKIEFRGTYEWTITKVKEGKEEKDRPAQENVKGVRTSQLYREGERLRIVDQVKIEVGNWEQAATDQELVLAKLNLEGAEKVYLLEGTKSVVLEGARMESRPYRVVVHQPKFPMERVTMYSGANLAVMDGFVLFGQGKHLADLMREGKDQQMKGVKLEGRDVVWVSAGTRFGKFSLWLDPKADYQPVRIEIERTGEDVQTWDEGKKLTDRGTVSDKIVVDEFTVERIGGRYLATGCRTNGTVTRASGEVVESKSTSRREGVKLDPVFDEGTFRFTAPQETPATVMWKIGKGDEETRYEWRGGKIVPVKKSPERTPPPVS